MSNLKLSEQFKTLVQGLNKILTGSETDKVTIEGVTKPTVWGYLKDALSAIENKADKSYVDNAVSGLQKGAYKFYPSLSSANNDIADIDVNTPVYIGDEGNGGLWYKASSESVELSRSMYDPKLTPMDDVKYRLSGVQTNVYRLNKGDFEQGNYGVFPALINASNRIRTKLGKHVDCRNYGECVFTVPDGFKLYVFDHDLSYPTNNALAMWVTGTNRLDLRHSQYVSFILSRVGDTAITPSVLDKLGLVVRFYGEEKLYVKNNGNISVNKKLVISPESDIVRMGAYNFEGIRIAPSSIRAVCKSPIPCEPNSTMFLKWNSSLWDVAVMENTGIGGTVVKDHAYLSIGGSGSIKLQQDTTNFVFTIKKKSGDIFALTDLDTIGLEITYRPPNKTNQVPFTIEDEVYITDKQVLKYLNDSTYEFGVFEFSEDTIRGVGIGSGFAWGGNFDGTRFGNTHSMEVAPNSKLVFKVPEGHSIALRYSDDESALKYDSGWIESGEYELDMNRAERYLRIAIRKKDNSTSNVQSIVNAGFEFKYVKLGSGLSYLTSKKSVAKGSVQSEKLGSLLLQAHSGCAYFGAFENSYDAFVHAGKAGFKVIEADIMLTSDKEFVVSHNKTIDSGYFVNKDGSQITTPVGITTVTLSEIRENYLTRSNVPKYRKPIVTLSEFLDICRKYGAFPRMEIQQWGTFDLKVYEKFIKEIRRYFKDNDVQIISFNISQLNAMSKVSDCMLGYLIYEITEAKLDSILAVTDRAFIDVERTYYNETAKKWIDDRRMFTSAWTCYNCGDVDSMVKLGINQIGVQYIPPFNGVPAGQVNRVWASNEDFSNCTIMGGVLQEDNRVHLGSMNSIEHIGSFDMSNGMVYIDVIGSGNFVVEAWVDNILASSATYSADGMITKKFASFHKSGSSFKLVVYTTSSCVIDSISFKDYNLDI